MIVSGFSFGFGSSLFYVKSGSLVLIGSYMGLGWFSEQVLTQFKVPYIG